MQGATQNALSVLRADTPEAKVNAANYLAEHWKSGRLTGERLDAIPDRPGRPEKPLLVPPADVKRRRLGSVSGRAALLHAVAHIEFNAIDLAADMIARFTFNDQIEEKRRDKFIHDWIGVCHDEARHFGLITDRMGEMGMAYGDLPAHDGLWEAAMTTSHNFAARMAIAPMVLEARGLDVTPSMIEKLTGHGDVESASVLKIIYNDEIGHVAAGAFWFQVIAEKSGNDPETYFHKLVKEHFAGRLKPPFNIQARTLAGLKQGFYMPLS